MTPQQRQAGIRARVIRLDLCTDYCVDVESQHSPSWLSVCEAVHIASRAQSLGDHSWRWRSTDSAYPSGLYVSDPPKTETPYSFGRYMMSDIAFLSELRRRTSLPRYAWYRTERFKLAQVFCGASLRCDSLISSEGIAPISFVKTAPKDARPHMSKPHICILCYGRLCEINPDAFYKLMNRRAHEAWTAIFEVPKT